MSGSGVAGAEVIKTAGERGLFSIPASREPPTCRFRRMESESFSNGLKFRKAMTSRWLLKAVNPFRCPLNVPTAYSSRLSNRLPQPANPMRRFPPKFWANGDRSGASVCQMCIRYHS